METKIGILSVFYVNDGTYGSPAWVEIDLISDLAVDAAWDEGESTARRTVVHTFEQTMLALDIPGKIRKDHSDAGYILIQNAFLSRAVIDILALDEDNDVNGATGFRFDGKVFTFSEDQAMGNVLFKDFTIKPCASVNVPKFATVVGGVPVFTDIGAVGGS
jgi:hypothetical protein